MPYNDNQNVVLYMRYSSTNQTEQSVEGQNHVCEEYCAKNGLNIVGKYIDRATSASHDTEKRTEFLRMIADSAKGYFSAVVVYRLDRFARNRYDSAIYKQKLRQNGVRLLSACEPLDESPESVILESVLEGMAEYYSKELAQKVRRGQRESVAKGVLMKKESASCGMRFLLFETRSVRLFTGSRSVPRTTDSRPPAKS